MLSELYFYEVIIRKHRKRIFVVALFIIAPKQKIQISVNERMNNQIVMHSYLAAFRIRQLFQRIGPSVLNFNIYTIYNPKIMYKIASKHNQFSK